MAKNNVGNKVGGWAFLIGILLAVVLGLLNRIDSTWTMILVIIGIIIGLLNITAKEVNAFLTSGAVLIIASSLGMPIIGNLDILSGVLRALLAIFVPATIIVAIKNVFSLAKA